MQPSYLKKSMGVIAIAVFSLSSLISVYGGLLSTNNTTVSFTITAGALSIGSPTSLIFSTPYSASLVTGSFNQDFNTSATGYFYVLDIKGSDTGYYTTLQLSGMFNASGASISGGYVEFKSVSSAPVLLSGLANSNVFIDANATGGYQSLSTARNWIIRSNGANTGVIGQYGQYINMKVTVPAGQAPGVYSGTLVYSLIEN